MNLEEIKCRYFARQAQILLFGEQGDVKASCESIFKVLQGPSPNVYAQFPLVESMQEVLADLKPGHQPFVLHRIELEREEHPGYFDLHFERLEDSLDLQLMIVDNTKSYSYLQELQTVGNASAIMNEEL